MSPSTSTRTITVTNRTGLHARAAILLASLARRFQSKVELVKDHERADATSVMEILSLGAAPGVCLVLEAHGDDADDALDAVERLFRGNFDEPQDD